jgi:hypothetical protein
MKPELEQADVLTDEGLALEAPRRENHSLVDVLTNFLRGDSKYVLEEDGEPSDC